MVALLLEDHDSSGTVLIPIIRGEQGEFAGLADVGPPVLGDSEGRFSKLMLRHKPSSADVDRAKHQLLVLGMSVENRGFDPNMN